MADVRILLLGKTGSGKSTAGNTILGKDKDVFGKDNSTHSVTKKCHKDCAEVDEQTVSVIDTPGLFDTLNEVEETKVEIERLFNFVDDGIHVILIVIRLDVKFTEEEEKSVKWIQDNFGKEATKYTMVLFTHGDHLKVPIDNYLKNSKLQSLVDQCGGGYHVFNNNAYDRSQVIKLLRKIELLKKKNEKKKYTKQNYMEAQKKLLSCGIGAAVGGMAGAAAARMGVAAGAAAISEGKARIFGAVAGAAATAAGVYMLLQKFSGRNGKKGN